MKEVELWAKQYEMKFNKNKSVIMIHKKANRYKEEEIQDIKQVDSAKVLGYQFNR